MSGDHQWNVGTSTGYEINKNTVYQVAILQPVMKS